ncbi:MAG: baseplate J/gp47 family protein [Anaerotignum sp.]|nr:baseplate J/gp47 family protein [Anaerotignum sp.]
MASYEALMERKLDMIKDKRDKRQGSLIYDALAPNAAETASFYADLDMLEDRTFADTALGDDLTRRAAERGIVRKQAVKATFYGRFRKENGEEYPIEEGTRFFLEGQYYVVISREEDGRYVLECETAGTGGNDHLGNLVPLETMAELTEAILEELRTDGEDEETDEELRKRYYASFAADAFGGNIADYKMKINALQNVGGVKVYPVWQGGGTVKVVVIDRGWRAPTQTELEELQMQIDPESRGEGYGIAPIGHQVTVTGVSEVVCNVTMTLSLTAGAVQETVLSDIRERIEAYFEETRKNWAESSYLTVRISYLEARILEADGVEDIADCSINGSSRNLVLDVDEVPLLGEIGVNA